MPARWWSRRRRASFSPARSTPTRERCSIARRARGRRRSRGSASIPGEVPDLVKVPPGCIFVERCAVRIPKCRVANPVCDRRGRARRRLYPGGRAVSALVEVDRLSVVFDGRLKAVDRVSFAVEEGETFGLVGESGSGKSTIAKALRRARSPGRGQPCASTGATSRASGGATGWDFAGRPRSSSRTRSLRCRRA